MRHSAGIDLYSSIGLIARSKWYLAACVVIVAALLPACDDSGDDPRDVENSSDKGDAGDEPDAAPALEPLLDPPARGEQFTMTTELPPQSESERCQFVVNENDLILNHDEMRFTTGSHHVLLFTTSYDEVPTEDLRGNAVDTSGVFDCTDGVQGFWKASGLIAASQSAQGDSAISLPEGVGIRIPAGAVLLINAHYINVTDRTLEPRVYINLHGIPEDELKEEGGLLFWYNPFLKVPASGESEMIASCPISEDIHVTNLQSHMHRRGVGYRATVVSADGGRDEIYTSDTWEDVPVEKFEPNVDVATGSRIEWRCAYQNSEERDVYQGPRSTDEMCMLIGSYYPRNDEIGFCAQRGSAFLGANWSIGKGTATCADSFNCVVDASSNNASSGGAATGSEAKGLTSAITDCLLASNPELEQPVSAMLGCLASVRKGMDALTVCKEEIDVCSKQ